MSLNRLSNKSRIAQQIQDEVFEDSIILAIPDNGRGDSDWEVSPDEAENTLLILTRAGDVENRVTTEIKTDIDDPVLDVKWSESGTPKPGDIIKNPVSKD